MWLGITPVAGGPIAAAPTLTWPYPRTIVKVTIGDSAGFDMHISDRAVWRMNVYDFLDFDMNLSDGFEETEEA